MISSGVGSTVYQVVTYSGKFSVNRDLKLKLLLLLNLKTFFLEINFSKAIVLLIVVAN